MATTVRNSQHSSLSLANLFHRVALCLLLMGTVGTSSFAGDSTYGTVLEVKSLDVVVLDTGAERYTVRLIGIEAPANLSLAKKGRQMLSDLVLKKRVQLRFEFRNDKNEMVGRILTLYTAKSDVTDAGEHLVKAGLAHRQDGFDYKCGCLTKAEKEAIDAKRGIWAAN